MASHKVPSLEKLLSLKLSELKKSCKENSLPYSGTKAELAERLHIFHVTAAEEARLLAGSEPNEAELLGELEEESSPQTAASATSGSAATSKPQAAGEASPKPAVKMTKVGKATKTGVKKKVASSKPSAGDASGNSASESTKTQKATVEKEKVEKKATSEENVTQESALPNEESGGEEKEKPKVPVAQMSDEERKRIRALRFASHLSSTDESLEARKRARAERFGLPYTPPKTGTSRGTGSVATASLAEGDLSRMEKRAARFGEVLSPALRTVMEDEKRQKRAERFGMSSTSAASTTPSGSGVSDEEKRKRRLERFGGAAVSAEKDSDEEARKKRRLERFGGAAATAGKPSLSAEQAEKLARRAERFGIVSDEAKKASRALRFGAAV